MGVDPTVPSILGKGKAEVGGGRYPRNEVLDLLSTKSLLKGIRKKEKKIEGFNPGFGLVGSPSLSIFSGTKYRFLFTLMGTCGGRKSPLFHPRTPWLGACIQHLEMIIALHAQRMDGWKPRFGKRDFSITDWDTEYYWSRFVTEEFFCGESKAPVFHPSD